MCAVATGWMHPHSPLAVPTAHANAGDYTANQNDRWLDPDALTAIPARHKLLTTLAPALLMRASLSLVVRFRLAAGRVAFSLASRLGWSLGEWRQLLRRRVRTVDRDHAVDDRVDLALVGERT